MVKYKNYGRPTLVVATRRGNPTVNAQSDCLASSLDQILKGFHEQATARPLDRPPATPPPQPALAERSIPPRSNQALANDLNNLLTVILGCGEVLADKMEGDESGTSYLKDLLAATVRAKQLAVRF
jgi:hypothetical protein